MGAPPKDRVSYSLVRRNVQAGEFVAESIHVLMDHGAPIGTACLTTVLYLAVDKEQARIRIDTRGALRRLDHSPPLWSAKGSFALPFKCIQKLPIAAHGLELQSQFTRP